MVLIVYKTNGEDSNFKEIGQNIKKEMTKLGYFSRSFSVFDDHVYIGFIGEPSPEKHSEASKYMKKLEDDGMTISGFK